MNEFILESSHEHWCIVYVSHFQGEGDTAYKERSHGMKRNGIITLASNEVNLVVFNLY
jgi:hypothetical protein